YADHWKLVGPSDAGLQPSQHLESYSPQIRNPFRFNKSVNRSRAYALTRSCRLWGANPKHIIDPSLTGCEPQRRYVKFLSLLAEGDRLVSEGAVRRHLTSVGRAVP